MYCVKCGVKLADTEKKCPLCGTVAYHPDLERPTTRPLYPSKKMPVPQAANKSLSGAMIFLLLIPLSICLFADIKPDGRLNWFGYVAGAMLVSYIAFALPLWFHRPNPVVFVPSSFVAAALYLLYIELATKGNWYLCFALPVTAGAGVIISTVVTLLYYIGKGRLYIFGGGFIALGAWLLMLELLLKLTFQISFTGWSVYPLIVLSLLGGFLIYLAINSVAREILERKLFI